jgi:Flp pilus assembly protein TadD
MKHHSTQILVAGVLAAGGVLLISGAVLCPSTVSKAATVDPARDPVKLTIDYPLNGSVFPPEITAPTFLWHDPSDSARTWTVDVTFTKHVGHLHVASAGEPLRLGAIDPKAGPEIELTPEQASTRTWKPGADTWTKIKQLSVNSPATITITGLADDGHTAISAGTVSISTSTDPVGAPVFYRDVPLMLPSAEQKGPITPLPQAALPLIKWRIRSIAEPESRVVMENLPTCANCHSFSRDGRTFGLDMDGPRNDKGLYALVKVSRDMTITKKDMIHWSGFQLNEEARAGDPAVKRFGFMSQVSPNGRYVVTSIGPPNNTNKNANETPGFAPGILDRLYSTNYRSIAFTQVFYPTRGILAWYDKSAGTMKPLPGADDPKYVQTSAFWSPDGKYLIFSRALARDPYPAGAAKPAYANDPNETQIQYGLYKIPFNEGRGGKAVPVAGASDNGMSNNFPKVSPDCKWIVWVECKNGLLMRPDSKLFIVPFEGGKARPLRANTPLMNSWHTFSPNGRWLAFSSKARGPYTQLMLTHIDSNGNDTPAVMVENTTAANRAVNIPEFVNLPEDETIAKINPEATEFYSLFDEAFREMADGKIPQAIQTISHAIQRDPTDALAHYVLATALSGNNQETEALAEYRKAAELEPKNPTYLDHLAISLDLSGDTVGALDALKKAIALEPSSPEYQFNLGVVLELRGDFAAAVDPLQRSVQLSRGRNWRSLAELAKASDKAGRPSDAVRAAQQAVTLAEQAHDETNATALRNALAGYEHNAANNGP